MPALLACETETRLGARMGAGGIHLSHHPLVRGIRLAVLPPHLRTPTPRMPLSIPQFRWRFLYT